MNKGIEKRGTERLAADLGCSVEQAERLAADLGCSVGQAADVLSEIIERSMEECSRMIAIAKLRRQRDALLAACKEADAVLGDRHRKLPHDSPIREQLRSAIALAEGGAK